MSAGDAVSRTRPYFWLGDFNPIPAILPATSLPLYGNWPTGWNRIKGFQNGLALTLLNTKVAITTSDLGNVDWVGNGGHGMTLAAQFRLPQADLIDKLAAYFSTAKAAATGPPAFPAVEIKSFDPTAQFGATDPGIFRVGIEGVLDAGSQYDTAKIHRWIGFKVRQTGNVVLRHDHTGADAGMFPTMTAQLLRHTVTAAEVAATGIGLTDIKSDMAVAMNIAVA
ncbi:MAG: hypothetical protein WKF67_15040 [Rubrobacteraceae bacterium]